jgi:hypothetical protein
MKRITSMVIVVVLFALHGNSQMLQPVKWGYAARNTGPNEAVIFLKATIDAGWHVYSQFVKEGGPVKTTIHFNPSKAFTVVGNTIEPKPVTRMEKAFGMDVIFFENSVVFQQKIKLKAR